VKKPIQFGKYYLLDRINVGGMAEVFKAKAFGVEGFERLLAVKRILPNIAEDEEFITMFIDEAKIAVQLNHANICQIFDLGKVEDSFFIALEFVHGKDLRAIFDRCKLKPPGNDGSAAMPIAQACFITMKACEGLDYAHNKRDAQGGELHLVHRDVSPQNFLISYEGEVKLIDFGIAKAAGKASKTQQGILKGKFGYMSPEQVRGLPLDRRSDIFSLGIVLYELLTAERLFVGESDFSTLEKVRNVEILPPSTYNRRIPEELERIVLKALAKDVDDRYQNAIDLHDDLQAFMYTAGEFYSRKDLAAWMKRVWATEIEAELAKIEAYRQMPTPPVSQPPPTPGAIPSASVPALGPGVAASAQGERERPRRPSGGQPVIAPPPPTPSAAMAQARTSGQHPTVPPPVPHTNGASAHERPVPGPNGQPELGWDDEELATNIYAAPPDASDAVLDDKPDLSKVELNPDGKVVPHPSFSQLSTIEPPTSPAVDLPRNGAAAPYTGFAASEPSRTGTQGASASSTFIVMCVLIALLCGAAVGGYVYFGNRPGELLLTSEPAANVQILIDNKRIAVDGTPASVPLGPGSYALTVQHEGFVPYSEQIEIKAHGRLAKHVALEPLASGGFQLSEPVGAQVYLDGRLLEGVTPLQVHSVMPGRHRVEVRGKEGTWADDVQLEAGRMVEVHATFPKPLPPVAAVTPPPRPIETPVEPPRRPAPVRESVHLAAAPEAPRERAVRVAPKKTVPAAAAPSDESPRDKPVPRLAEKPAIAGAGEGYLRLGSRPWTNITVDGKDTGLHTPQTHMKLPAGSHRITLANPQFGVKETFSVEISAGATETIIKDLRPAGSGGAADSD
jgi:serine/threonine protein kinase